MKYFLDAELIHDVSVQPAPILSVGKKNARSKKALKKPPIRSAGKNRSKETLKTNVCVRICNAQSLDVDTKIRNPKEQLVSERAAILSESNPQPGGSDDDSKRFVLFRAPVVKHKINKRMIFFAEPANHRIKVYPIFPYPLQINLIPARIFVQRWAIKPLVSQMI